MSYGTISTPKINKKEAKSAICQSHATIGALYGLFAVRETQKQVTIKGISYARYAQERLRR